jgi:hypothetical protein
MRAPTYAAIAVMALAASTHVAAQDVGTFNLDAPGRERVNGAAIFSLALRDSPDQLWSLRTRSSVAAPSSYLRIVLTYNFVTLSMVDRSLRMLA